MIHSYDTDYDDAILKKYCEIGINIKVAEVQVVGLLPLNFEFHSLNPSDSHFQCSCSSIGRMAAQVIRRLMAHICFNLLKL